MKQLILLRHSKAAPAESAPDDRARMLSERGRQEAHAAGAAMKALQIAADAVLVSPAARTRETAQIALASLDAPPPLFVEALYMADAEAIWEAAQSSGAGRVIIVGHNPGLQELAAELVRQAHDKSRAARAILEGFPTSAFAAFDIAGDVLDAAAPRLVDAWRPEK